MKLGQLSHSWRFCLVSLFCHFFILVAASSDEVPICHVDASPSVGIATSKGSWAGIAYEIVFQLDLCLVESPSRGVLWAALNDHNQSMTGRSGELVYDAVGLVRFTVAREANGDNVLSTTLCWSESQCAVLCARQPIGRSKVCRGMYISFLFVLVAFWLAFAVICVGLLLALYRRKQKTERQVALAQRAQHIDEGFLGSEYPTSLTDPPFYTLPLYSHSTTAPVLEEDATGSMTVLLHGGFDKSATIKRMMTGTKSTAEQAVTIHPVLDLPVVTSPGDAPPLRKDETCVYKESLKTFITTVLEDTATTGLPMARMDGNSALEADLLVENGLHDICTQDEGEILARHSTPSYPSFDDVPNVSVTVTDFSHTEIGKGGTTGFISVDVMAPRDSAIVSEGEHLPYSDALNHAADVHAADNSFDRYAGSLVAHPDGGVLNGHNPVLHGSVPVTRVEIHADSMAQKSESPYMHLENGLTTGELQLCATPLSEEEGGAGNDLAQAHGAKSISPLACVVESPLYTPPSACEHLTEELSRLITDEMSLRHIILSEAMNTWMVWMCVADEASCRAELHEMHDSSHTNLRALCDLGIDNIVRQKEYAASLTLCMTAEMEARMVIEQQRAMTVCCAVCELREVEGRKEVQKAERHEWLSLENMLGVELLAWRVQQAAREQLLAEIEKLQEEYFHSAVGGDDSAIVAEEARNWQFLCFMQVEGADRIGISDMERAQRHQIASVFHELSLAEHRRLLHRHEGGSGSEGEADCEVMQIRALSLLGSPFESEMGENTETTNALLERERVNVSAASAGYNEAYQERMLALVHPPKGRPLPPPFLGFSIAEIVEEATLVVDALHEGGPAHQTGICVGDILISIEEHVVRTLADVSRAVALCCHPSYLTRMTLMRTTGEPYTVVLWIMTTDRRYVGFPFYFDVPQHQLVHRSRQEIPAQPLVPPGVETHPAGSTADTDTSAPHTDGGLNHSL